MPIKEVKFEPSDVEKLFKKSSPTRFLFKQTKRFTKSLFLIALVFGAAFLLINYSAYYERTRYTLASKPTTESSTPEPVVQPTVDYAPEIQIPKLGLKAPITLDVESPQTLEKLQVGVAHQFATAKPGERGNSVLIGHSSDFPWSPGQYKTVFALLDKLTTGDQILIAYKSQILTYEVAEKKVISPDDLSVLTKTDQPTLTLVTCYPVGSTKSRLIIRAGLAKGQITGDQLVEPNLTALPKAR